MLDYLGLDAFTFLEFLRLLRWLFALITVFVALPLICANYFINTQTDWGSTTTAITTSSESGMQAQNLTSAIGDLQLFTAANITGNALWVHISAEMAVTMIVFLQGKPLLSFTVIIRVSADAFPTSQDIFTETRESDRDLERYVSTPPLF